MMGEELGLRLNGALRQLCPVLAQVCRLPHGVPTDPFLAARRGQSCSGSPPTAAGGEATSGVRGTEFES